MKCNKCNSVCLELCYQKYKNGTKHLLGLCEKHGWRCLPFISGLDIPKTTGKLKSKNRRGQRIYKPQNQNTLF
jgi:hypothetical protein